MVFTMSDVIKYNYDVVVISDNELAQYGHVKPNETMLVQIGDDVKNDIQNLNNRDAIIRNIIENPDLGLCIGFNFEGKEQRRDGSIFWNTRVFYYNQFKDWFWNQRKSRRGW